MKHLLSIAFILGCLANANAQLKKITQYYGSDSTNIKNVFFVKTDSVNVLHGPFTQFFENGKPSIQGQYKNNQPTGTWTYNYESGLIKQKGTLSGEQKGHWEFYYENGSLMKDGSLNGKREEGHWNYYYENGHLRKSGDYYNGMKQGQWEYFYEDSVKKAVANFENGTGYYQEYYYDGSLKKEGALVNEHSEGIWTYYYDNGSVKAKGLELDGSKNGHWEYFYPDGTKSSEGSYSRNKKHGQWTFYQQNGEIQTEGEIQGGEREGNWMVYNTDGSFNTRINYDNNEGVYEEYHPNGQLKVRGKLVGANHEGKWEYYYDDGTLEAECDYKDNTGLYKSYYPNGKPKDEGTLVGTNRTGLWKLYDKDGKVVYLRTVYNNDSPNAIVSDSVTVEDITQGPKESNKKFVYKQPAKWKKNIRWLKPRPNEAKGLIIETNPVALLANSIPISIEYFIQERQGYQVRYRFIRDPFFKNPKNVPNEEVYSIGSSIDFTAKIYSLNYSHGMWFIGPNLDASFMQYSSKAYTVPEDITSPTETLRVKETSFELSAVGGNRYVKSFKQSGFTLEVYAGLGFGYRDFNKLYDENHRYQEALFSGLSQGKFYVPFKLGFSFGYFFL